MPAVASVSLTGNPYTDGVLSGIKWAGASLTYSFPTAPSFYGSNYGGGEQTSQFKAFTATQQAAVHKVLDDYAAVTNLRFTQVTETSTQHGDLRYAESDKPSTAWGYYPTTAAEGGDAWFNNSRHYYDNPLLGNYAFLTILHETGHTLGLKHPHEASGAFRAMPADKDSLEYSVMSYHSYVGSPLSGYTNGSYSYPQSLMMYDIAALQAMYGANYTTNSGDTVYKWSSTTGEMFVNGAGHGAPGGNRIFETIWDGSGNDTYDFSNYANSLKIDLNPGGWSTVSTTQLANLGSTKLAAGNIANSLLYHENQASLIENAIGGSGNDTIIGNIAGNRLTGGKGNDHLDGVAGTDTAIYSGLHTDYRLVQNADATWTITDLRTGSPDGIDTLAHIEFLKFSDTTSAVGAQPQPPAPPQPPPPASVNHAPVAVNDVAQTLEDNAVNINVLANDSDPDGNALSIFGLPTALHGTVTVNSNGTLHYLAAANYSGADTISYAVTDGSLTAAGKVAVTVTPANDAPVAHDDSYSAGKNSKVTISGTGVLGNDTDADGGALSATLVSNPTHGTLKFNGHGSFTYTPVKNFVGTDSFSYKDFDGSALSNTATVTIAVGLGGGQKGQDTGGHFGGLDMSDDQVLAPVDQHDPHAHGMGTMTLLDVLHHDHGFLL